MDYAEVYIRLGQELREVHKYANEREIKTALDKAVEVRKLASDLVYALSHAKQS